MSKKIAIVACSGLAAAASADVIGPASGNAPTGTSNAPVSISTTPSVQGTPNTTFTITFDEDVASWDAQGDADNVVLDLDLNAAAGTPAGSPVDVTGLGWDVTLETNGASWLADMNAGFEGTINLAPGAADSEPGMASYTQDPPLDLTDNMLPNIEVPDGILTIEFFESFDDVANEIDGNWLAGSEIVLEANVVPAPGAAALLGLGGLVATRRRR